MLPTGHHAGKGCTKDRRKPKQPELRDIGAARKQRRSGAARRIDRGVRDRDEEKVNERQTEPDGYAGKPTAAPLEVVPMITYKKKNVAMTSTRKQDTKLYLPGLRSP